MRTDTFKNDKMADLLKKKDGFIEKGRALTKVIEEAESDRNKLGLKVQKIKDKMVDLVEKIDIKLDEFEYLRTIELKGKDIEVSIHNAQEEWVEAYREAKKEEKEEAPKES